MENIQNAAPAQAGAENSNAGQASASPLDAVEKSYITPDRVQIDGQAAITAANEACKAAGVSPVMNFDASKPFPAGCGLLILPVNKREGQGTKVVTICFGAVPDAATIAQSEGGEDFIRTAVMDKVFAKLANAVRPRGDSGEIGTNLPQTVADFITRQERGTSLTTFRELASSYVSALKSKGVKFMTPQILRQVLSCTAFAQQQFAKVPQAVWVKVLDSMIAAASKKKLDPSILLEWKSTRDSAEFEVAELDFSDLSGLIDDKASAA